MDIIVIGIAGGTGSGKTTITNRLIKEFGSRVTVLTHDNYYKSTTGMSHDERIAQNYDHPDAFDTELLVEHLTQLKAGQPVESPLYDYALYNRSGQTQTIHPSPVIILEGILIYSSKALRDLMDIRIFVDADADVRILRRIRRDMEERGRSLDSVINQYLTTVKPMHEAFVEPSKRYANIIIPGGGYNEVANQMVVERVRAHLEGRVSV